MDRLADVLERMAAQPMQLPPVREPFKAPQFEGTGDVEYFINQFIEVAQANNWVPAAALIHLRAALRDSARDCGKADTLDGVFAALRARFGLTTREARAKLATLRRENKVTLQEHAAEVERLVNVAYMDLPAANREQMVLDTFHSTIGDAYLQRHLLAINTPDLATAVRAGNEYLQIRPTRYSGSNVRQVDGEVEPRAGEEAQIASVSNQSMHSLLQAVKSLAEQIEAMKAENKSIQKPEGKKSGPKSNKCYGCQGEGHIRRNCPTNPWPAKTKTEAGNEEGPQQ